MAYGWLTTRFGGWQQHGFFVAPDDRILYWPRRCAPGYVIDHDLARRIMAPPEVGSMAVGFVVGAVFIFIVFAIGAAARQKLHPVGFSPHAVFFLGALAAMAVILPLFVLYVIRGCREGLRRVDILLVGREIVDQPRPRAQWVKPSWHMKRRDRVALALGLVFWPALFALFWLAPSIPGGDRWVGMGLAVSVMVVTVIIGWLEVTGVRLASVRVLASFDPDLPPPD